MPKYTIRVYGLWINNRHEILLSDEHLDDYKFTKFPGGGMEAGEGPIECLKREWLEELQIEIDVLDHFFTTDFYQASAFHTDTQLISLYYFVRPIKFDADRFSTAVKDFEYNQSREELFRWASLDKLKISDLTFPIDQKVVALLQNENAR